MPLTRTRRLLLALVLILLVSFLAAPAVARGLATYLMDMQEPARADAALVLAGDPWCRRIDRAAELVRGGFTARVLVSSPVAIYGVPEGELAVACAIRHGHPREAFEILHVRALSTVEEAEQIVPLLKQRGVRDLLIVTSESHTRRAGKAYRSRLGPGVTVRMVGAPDPYFKADSWWKHHEGREIVFFEWAKTAATALGL